MTLVELLVATSLMALVGSATVATLGGGMRVWERTLAFGTHQQEVLLAFERIRRDVESHRRFAPIPFEGVYNRCSVAAVERDPADPSGPLEVGQLGYFHDERHHRLCRSFVPYRLMQRSRLKDRCQSVLNGVTRVRIQYFGIEESGQPAWSGDWTPTRPPWGMKVELTMERDRQRTATYSQVIYLTNSPSSDDDETTP